MPRGTVTAWNGQVFDVIGPEDLPQDLDGDGHELRFLRFETSEHDEMMAPRAIEVVDAEGRWAIYVPLEIDGKLVRPQQSPPSRPR